MKLSKEKKELIQKLEDKLINANDDLKKRIKSKIESMKSGKYILK